MIVILFWLLTLLFMLMSYAISWFLTCFIIWAIAGLFGLTVTWQFATVIWLIILVVASLVKYIKRIS